MILSYLVQDVKDINQMKRSSSVTTQLKGLRIAKGRSDDGFFLRGSEKSIDKEPDVPLLFRRNSSKI